MLELSDKDFKAAVIKMCQQAVSDSLKTKEKIKNLRNEIVIKNNQIKIK